MRQQKRDDDVSAKIGWSPEGTGDGGTRPWHVCPRCRELKHLFFRRQRIKLMPLAMINANRNAMAQSAVNVATGIHTP
jgi:hypothetical protein